MMRTGFLMTLAGVVILTLACPLPVQHHMEKHSTGTSSGVSGMTPKPYFETNLGQMDRADVVYFSKSPALEVGFAKGRVFYNGLNPRNRAGGILFALEVGDGSPEPEALEPLEGRSHYLRGTDRKEWVKDVPHFGRVRYREAHPGIDLVFFFDPEGRLTYEFHVQPGADPAAIALRYAAVDRVEPVGGDRMDVVTGVGRLKDGPLVCYQEVNGERRVVESRFRREGESSYTVDLLEPHDSARPLVVDPTIVFSSYWGSGGANNRTVQIDPAGNIYLSGGTSSTTWPTTTGAYQNNHSGSSWPDVVTAKFDPNGNVVWSTYIGGSGEDYAYVSAVNSSGELYLGGRAGTGFPTTPGAIDETFNGGVGAGSVHSPTDAFVVKLSRDGDQLLYSTYLGGNADENARAIHLLPSGEVIVGGGNSASTNLPATPGAYKTSRGGAQDAFVARLAADGRSLVFFTYFGPNNDSGGDETIRALGTDASGNIWIGGTTGGTDLVPTADAFQSVRGGGSSGYIAKLSSDGRNLVYLSWLGGNAFDEIETEGVSDAAGNFYVAGSTASADFPVTAGAFQSVLKAGWDGFVARINNDGSLGFSTLYGGTTSGPEACFGPVVDSQGNVYASGRFRSPDCLLTPNAFQSQHGSPGSHDSILIVFSPDGRQLLYGTYFGGGGSDMGRHIGIAPDESAVVIVGETSSTNLPLVNAPQSTPAGAFMAKFDVTDISSSSGAGPLSVSPATGLSASGVAGGPFTPSSATYTVTNSGTASIDWTASAGQPWVGVSPSGGSLAGGASATVTVSIGAAASSLGAGSYSDTVVFTNTTNGSGNTSRSVDLTVTGATPGPLAVSPTGGLSSSGAVGGPFSPSNLVLTLTNTGTASLDWTASATQGWVTLSSGGGTLTAGQSVPFTISIGTGAAALGAGSYSDTVTLTNTTNGSGSTTRPVSLTVTGTAQMAVTPTGGLASSGPVGGSFSPSSTAYTLENTGTATLSWTASAGQSWVSLSSSGGSLASGATTSVTVTINSGANGLAAGIHTDTVTFTNATNGSGNSTRGVTLTVSTTPPPTVTFPSPPTSTSTNPLVVNGTASGGTITSVTWTNAATGGSGTASGTSTWTASIPLSPGANPITVTVFNSQGGSSSRSFTVTYTPGSGGSKGSGGCGATGAEAAFLFILFLLRRRRRS